MIITDFTELEKKVQKVAGRLEQDSEKAQDIEKAVKDILKEVKSSTNREQTIKDFNKKFDNAVVEELRINPTGHFEKLDSKQQEAVKLACERIKKFQTACLPKKYSLTEGSDHMELVFTPIDSVGVYAPGGAAPLLSTLMMTAVPAQVAGVKRIVLTSPPPIHNYILAVADYLGIDEVYQVGGAQAVASLAYGIDEIGLEPVDKIVGPGNPYVTIAKKIVFGKVGIDALYGPSELVIIADGNANPKQIAHDLMSQLEHGSGFEAACLFTNSNDLASSALKEFEAILDKQPNKDAIQKAWANYGVIGVVENLERCAYLSNLFAPEHLEVKVTNYQELLPSIKHAGAIFINKSNEALGDYLAGPSHCLPTNRSARFSSGLSVMDFLKRSSLINLEPTSDLVEATATLARMEGLEAHAQAALSVTL